VLDDAGAEAIMAFLEAHPDPLAPKTARVPAALHPAPLPQLVEKSAIFGRGSVSYLPPSVWPVGMVSVHPQIAPEMALRKAA
jgi:hypothetical protein